jgi:anti-sigma B factor antagonist
MTIQEEIVSDVALVRISGRVTLTDGTTVFDNTLQRLIKDGRVKLIIDLGDVPYIDSTALGIILRAHATVTRRGGTL